METTVKLYSLEYREAKTYSLAALFVAGNIVLPQLCHTVHMGGPTWLPIYLFTLVGAYKYGRCVGLLTAVASPLLNSALFGMPAAAALPAILLKSTLLALIAGFALPQGFVAAVRRRGAGLPDGRHIGRMGPIGQPLRRGAGFPHRNSRDAAPGIRRLGGSQLPDPKIDT